MRKCSLNRIYTTCKPLHRKWGSGSLTIYKKLDIITILLYCFIFDQPDFILNDRQNLFNKSNLSFVTYLIILKTKELPYWKKLIGEWKMLKIIIIGERVILNMVQPSDIEIPIPS